MTDNEAAKQETLRWLKTAFVIQAVILVACIVMIAYAFAIVLPRLHRQQIKDQATIELQKDQLERTKDQLVRRYEESAELYYHSSNDGPNGANANNALAALDAALMIDPNATEAMNYKALILADRGDQKSLRDALSVLVESNQKKPNQDAYEQSGIIYCRTGQDENAIQTFQQESQISPKRMHDLLRSSEFNKYCSQNVKDWLAKLVSIETTHL